MNEVVTENNCFQLPHTIVRSISLVNYFTYDTGVNTNMLKNGKKRTVACIDRAVPPGEPARVISRQNRFLIWYASCTHFHLIWFHFAGRWISIVITKVSSPLAVFERWNLQRVFLRLIREGMFITIQLYNNLIIVYKITTLYP